jgi:hypothetical protein
MCHEDRHGNTGCYLAIPLKARLEGVLFRLLQIWRPSSDLLTYEVLERCEEGWDELVKLGRIETSGVSARQEPPRNCSRNHNTTTIFPALGCISGATYVQTDQRGFFPL